MSLSDPQFGLIARRTRAIACGLSVAAAVALAGCTSGFQPMHASLGPGPALSDKMKAVKVAAIPGRVGQRIRNELIFQTTGDGQERGAAQYRLDVAISERVTSTLVDRQGDSVNRVYSLDATFRLVDLNTQQVALTGSSFGRSTFQRTDSIYANVRAQRDAQNRAAETVSTDLKARLEAFLATRA
ncbi:MAG: LPS assembly lipoprotein LptE [Pseudomonadota bacterium]